MIDHTHTIVFPGGISTEKKGTILHWHKALNEQVSAGELLVDLATDKAVHGLEAPCDGYLRAIYAPAGAVVFEDSALGWVHPSAEAPKEPAPFWIDWDTSIAPAPPDIQTRLAVTENALKDLLQQEAQAAPRTDSGQGTEHPFSTASATAPLQAQRKQSSREMPPNQHLQRLPDRVKPLLDNFRERHLPWVKERLSYIWPRSNSNMLRALPETLRLKYAPWLKAHLQKVTALRMMASWEAPKVDLFTEVDFSEVYLHRISLKTAEQLVPSYNAYIIHAVVQAFIALPQYNVRYEAGEISRRSSIDIGIAVALEDDLVTMTLKDIASSNVQDIQRHFSKMVRKALKVTLDHSELYDSSLTVTNLGEYEVSAFSALLNPPQPFVLAIGAVKEQVVVKQGQMTIAPCCTICLSFDHRVINGAPAARVLQQIKHHLGGSWEGK